MPNQSDPNQPQNPATPAVTPPVDTPPIIPDFQAMDTPSVPTENVSIPTQVQTPKEDGTSSPPESLSVVSPGPKKKFGTGKIVATILGILLLIGGVGTGVYLTRQQQDVRDKAYTSDALRDTCDKLEITPSEPVQCPRLDNETETNSISNYATRYSVKNITSSPHTINYVKHSNWCTEPYAVAESNYYVCQSNPVNATGSAEIAPNQTVEISIERASGAGVACGSYQTDLIITSIDGDTSCGFINSSMLAGFGVCQTGITCPAATASCRDVKAYNASYTLLTASQLSQLKSGDQVNFCVAGTTTEGTFQKGKFTINGVVQAETTTKRTGSDDFCQLYTIPAATTTFNVTAQIYHSTLGWK